MKSIVTIGGGRRGVRGTGVIDREIIRLSGKKHPRLLFLPTAIGDDPSYWDRIRKYFAGRLGCEADVLFLIKDRPSKAEIRRKILGADIVYVGGGSTARLMRWWRRLGVDRALKTAYRRGVVLSGISAGAICWFDEGCYYHKQKRRYVRVKGLGLIRGIHRPHYDRAILDRPEGKHFERMIRAAGDLVIGIEDNCAIEFIDGKRYRLIAARKRAGAFRVYRRGSEIVSERIACRNQWSPVAELYSGKPPS